ncbi:glycosyltransferase [Acuticoccus sp. M5D2P5]|uniref:glycosyltransferase n=1 Tax=Acuticoccus kalidii TaxID=2910977 RepID=UPI001F26B26A|nr:glycosyltransferase [Acuticoccus kalidii]MCF3936658.1 glycosyltransferase [Acuticoccus kalidii]
MRIFLAAASFRPEYGGPARSVSRLGTALAAAGHEVTLWSSDGSAPTSPVVAGMMRRAGLSADAPLRRLGGSLKRALAPPLDIVHDNGIWRAHNHAIARICRARRIARVVSPRGMLEPWAVGQKGVQKRLALLAYQRGDLARADILHATAEAEAENLARLALSVPIMIAPNGVDLPSKRASPGLTRASRTMLFLGRLHPKKGLVMLVDAFDRLRPDGWRLIIAGPDSAGHREAVARHVDNVGLGATITFAGPLYGEAKSRLFAEADLFVLPTHSENFGLTVAEALAHALPVLTTTGAPWSILRDKDCGWWVPPTLDGVVDGLRLAIEAAPERRAEMGRKGRDLVAAGYDWARIADGLTMIYEAAQERAARRALTSRCAARGEAVSDNDTISTTRGERPLRGRARLLRAVRRPSRGAVLPADTVS